MSERYLVAGPYRLDLREERLWQGEAPIRLGGKGLALLRALMENPCALVTKVQLFDRVWPGLAVSDAVLTTAVKEVRRALGDDARRPSLIETVHGRGYRFLLPVERRDETPVGAAAAAGPAVATDPPVRAPLAVAGPRRFLLAGLGAAGVLTGLALAALLVLRDDAAAPAPAAPRPAAEAAAHPKSIAVLPFADLSPDSSRAWFADGLTEEILNSLARTPDLRVASRTSSSQLPGAGQSVQEAARALGVANVLEGSVRRSGGRVRVTAQLIRASDGFHLWSQNYDRTESDVISIQEDIAFAIASALKTVMEPERLRAMVEAGTRSVDAYEAYLQGVATDQQQLEDGDVAHSRVAADAYERARTLDPNFAEAHWKSAQTWFGHATRVNSNWRGDGLTEAEKLARYYDRIDAAIATSKDETVRLKYQAARASTQLRFQAARALMARYVALQPRDIDAWEEMAALSAYAGDRRAMAVAAERIHTLSVDVGDPRSRAITVSTHALQLEDAVARARQQLALRPANALTQYQAHRAFIWAGEIDAARTLLNQIRVSTMPPENKLMSELRQACAEGRRAEAMTLRARIDADAKLGTRWQAAQLAGDPQGAAELLRPLDTPEQLATLMQFMIYPTFDARAYPVLTAQLTRNGVVPPQAIRTPYACSAAPGA